MKVARIASEPAQIREGPSIDLRDMLQRVRVRVLVPILVKPESNVAIFGALKKVVRTRYWPRTKLTS